MTANCECKWDTKVQPDGAGEELCWFRNDSQQSIRDKLGGAVISTTACGPTSLGCR